MNTVGRHVLAELYECDQNVINDIDYIREQMLLGADKIGATVVGSSFHRFSPSGISGVVIIAESHLSVHTWPESHYVAMDIYTCGNLDPVPGIEFIGLSLGSQRCRIQVILRGLPEDIDARSDRPSRDTKLITLMTPARALSAVE